MTITPHELLKDYKANFKKVGHDEAVKILRLRIVGRLGHAWFMKHREKILKECEEIEVGKSKAKKLQISSEEK